MRLSASAFPRLFLWQTDLQLSMGFGFVCRPVQLQPWSTRYRRLAQKTCPSHCSQSKGATTRPRLSWWRERDGHGRKRRGNRPNTPSPKSKPPHGPNSAIAETVNHKTQDRDGCTPLLAQICTRRYIPRTTRQTRRPAGRSASAAPDCTPPASPPPSLPLRASVPHPPTCPPPWPAPSLRRPPHRDGALTSSPRCREEQRRA